MNVLAVDIADSVLYCDSVNDIWTNLDERFDQANGARLYQLQKDICSISQGSSDIATYFTKLKKNWDELSIVS